jgi:cell shape-determining protein MreC
MPAAALPDPIKAGTVLATLDPGQAALFTAIFVAVLMSAMAFALAVALIRAQSSASAMAERFQSAASTMAERFQSAASKLAEATTTQDTQHAVQLALLQQGQSDLRQLLGEALAILRARQ